MNFLFEALLKLAPNADFYIEDDIITWNSSDITQPTEEEINAKIAELKNLEPMRLLREERNRRLQETDWTQYRDVTLSNDSDWQTYRQSLRDLPSTASPELDDNGQLSNVTWPTKPEIAG